MLGTKITQLKTAMSEILSNLAKGDRFNIIRFNGDVTKWWNHSALVEVNEYSVSAAKNFINDMEADGCKLSSASLECCWFSVDGLKNLVMNTYHQSVYAKGTVRY